MAIFTRLFVYCNTEKTNSNLETTEFKYTFLVALLYLFVRTYIINRIDNTYHRISLFPYKKEHYIVEINVDDFSYTPFFRNFDCIFTLRTYSKLYSQFNYKTTG